VQGHEHDGIVIWHCNLLFVGPLFIWMCIGNQVVLCCLRGDFTVIGGLLAQIYVHTLTRCVTSIYIRTGKIFPIQSSQAHLFVAYILQTGLGSKGKNLSLQKKSAFTSATCMHSEESYTRHTLIG
jgi:hypothetical protein